MALEQDQPDRALAVIGDDDTPFDMWAWVISQAEVRARAGDLEAFRMIHEDGQAFPVLVQTLEHLALRQTQVGLGTFVFAALPHVLNVFAHQSIGLGISAGDA